jgi:hypothetical protein
MKFLQCSVEGNGFGPSFHHIVTNTSHQSEIYPYIVQGTIYSNVGNMVHRHQPIETENVSLAIFWQVSFKKEI